MPHSNDITKIQRINGVREIRLDRTLNAARAAENNAKAAELAAQEQERRDIAAADAARDATYSNPACTQTRLWQSIAEERKESATLQAEAATDDRIIASEIAARHAANLRVHKIKSDSISEYGRKLRRQENRQAEIRSEDELQPQPKGRII
jgi:hypothetical protein